MLTSLGFLLFLGYFASVICKKIGLPPLIGMIFAGVAAGPHALNLLSPALLDIAPDLRQFALVVILLRAGLAVRLDDLKAVGRPAILLCFVPATLEIIGVCVIAPILLGLTLIESAILGAVIAAVSPAVIVPRMLYLIEQGYGRVPQMIMAAASLDDIFVIVLFTSFTSMAVGGTISVVDWLTIPISIILGVLAGAIAGVLLNIYFLKADVPPVYKLVLMLASSFLLLGCETLLKQIPVISLSALLAIIVMSATLYKLAPTGAPALTKIFAGVWQVAEIMLFVLVGTAVNITYALSAGFSVVAMLLFALIFRIFGVFISTMGGSIPKKERLFTAFAYLPKATVQAAIGAIPLSLGLPCGEIVLTAAVLAILFTAPLGAVAIDKTYKTLLTKPV